VANNVPAFEFNKDGTYRGLLVEPGATNLVERSQEANNAYWTKSAMTIGTDAGVAPDGTTTADKLIPNAGSVTPHLNRTMTLTSGVAYTISVFVKADGYNFAYISHGATNTSAWFNLATGTVATVTANVTATSIQALPNGWYRISSTAVTTSTSQTIRACGVSEDDNDTTFDADGTSGILWWNAQMETGSVATSPIVTTGSTAARVADVISLTGASSLIGQTEGTIYIDYEVPIYTSAGNRRLFTLSQGTSQILLQLTTTGNLNYTVIDTGATQVSITEGVTSALPRKAAFCYKVNDFALYTNAASIGTDASGTVPATDTTTLGANGVGSQQVQGWIRSVALFPTRLANATLASLTTP
jgi:hypothetical protein